MTNKSSRFTPITKDIQEIVNKNGNDPENLLEVLTDIQDLPDSLTNENIAINARTLGIPEHHAYEVKSFYSMLFT